VTSGSPVAPSVVRARNAVAVVFAVNGLGIATWLSRLPEIRDSLGLSPSRLGLLLISGSAGAVLTLPVSGWLVHRLRPPGTVRLGALLSLAGVALVGVAGGGVAGGVPLTAIGLFCFGVGNSTWDVAMNVEGAQVERGLGRPIMPRFHAAFSLGTVGGALLGALAQAFTVKVPVAVHLVVVAAVVALAVVVSVRTFLPVPEDSLPGTVALAAGRGPSGAAAAWLEPLTLMLGLATLGAALSEGSAGDWLAIGFVDGYHVSRAVADVGYGLFVSAMTLARLFGPPVLDRFGRVATLRGSAVLVMIGVLLFVGGASVAGSGGASRPLGLALAAVAALAWGSGAALGFPVAMSAASDDPARAAARVSVVASLGYVAFLAGPPVLGLLGDRVGVVRALLAVVAAVVFSLLCAGAARARPTMR
jgi:MFS family permease